MKVSKAPAAETSSLRRSQPTRQTRTNPPRNSANARPNNGRDSLASAPTGDQPIEIFPATTFFADVMTALPKDLVRHFTLLKEVDAKLCAPQQELFKLVEAASSLPHPEAHTKNESTTTALPSSAPMSAQNSSSGLNNRDRVPPPASTAGSHQTSTSVFDPSNLPRRQLYRQTALKINEMLVALEEKNHVLNTANDALQRHLTRIEDVWPYLENEFSDEAKYGSKTHWAYPENRTGRNSQPERTRANGAAAISAAAAALAEEAAARSDARKQAVQAKKNAKNNNSNNNNQQQTESDFDDQGNPRAEAGRKSGPGKGRKTTNNDNNNVGLGISSTSAASGSQPSKKRKAEAIANSGTGDRGTSGTASGNTGPKANKTTGTSETPAPEGPRKRKALPSGSGQVKKKVSAVVSSTTSSPVIGSLSEPKGPARASPPPTTAPRPPTVRSRQNSMQSNKSRPSTVAGIKANNSVASGSTEQLAPVSAPASGCDDGSVKESNVPAKSEQPKNDGSTADGLENKASDAPVPDGMEVDTHDRDSPKKESTTPPAATQPTPTVTTKSGRASKPSTPALATFQDAARPRSSRNVDGGIHAKKGQKKGTAPSQAAAASASSLGTTAVDDDQTSGEGDIDADEPTYCYCNSVSYGEMVACDADDCEREWFHLACVGLKVAPPVSSTWYCNDCKERRKTNGGKKVGNR